MPTPPLPLPPRAWGCLHHHRDVFITVVHAKTVGARRRSLTIQVKASGRLKKAELTSAILMDCYTQCRRLQALLSGRKQWSFLAQCGCARSALPIPRKASKACLLNAWNRLQKTVEKEVLFFFKHFPAAPLPSSSTQGKLAVVQALQAQKVPPLPARIADRAPLGDEDVARRLHEAEKQAWWRRRRRPSKVSA